MPINPRQINYRPQKVPQLVGVTILSFGAFLIGAYIDHQEVNRRTRFRDKSMMHGKPKAEGEAPSWGGDYWSICK